MATTLANIPRVFSQVDQLTDALQLGGGKLLWVDAARGNDATAQRGKRHRPFATCGLAKTLAQSGDTIIVQPGTYNENDLAKNGVNWQIENGAQIFFSYHATNATAIKGVFEVATAMTFRISGRGWIDMTVDEENPSDAGSQDLHAVHITHASANVTVECRAISASIQLESGSGGCVLQTNGTATYNIDDPGDVTISGGTATLNTNALALNVSGGTVRGFPVYCAQCQCSGGTMNISAAQFGSLTISGGTANVFAGDAGTVAISGGTVELAAPVATSLTRTGSNGTAHISIDHYRTSLTVQQSGTALTVLHRGYLEVATAPAVSISGGKTIWRGGEVRETAPTGAHGTDIAIGIGSALVGTDLTLENMIVRCNDSTHSCLRVFAEDLGPSTFRVIGGIYQAGSAGYWFDPEAARTVTTRGVINVNRPAGPFFTQGGNGSILTDSSVNL